MDELSLFTGAGGGVWASKLLGWRTLGYVETNPYCQRVIRRRIWDGQFDNAPVFGDVRSFVDQGYARAYQGMVDVVTGGFPCQPFSCAGKRRGADDERNMWPATTRVLDIVRPEWAFLENVPGLLSSGYFEAVIADLALLGYDVEWCVLGADDVGAPHKRKRLWILAHGDQGGQQEHQELDCQEEQDSADGDSRRRYVGRCCGQENMAHAERQSLALRQGERGDIPEEQPTAERGRCTWWDQDPADVGDAKRSGFNWGPQDERRGAVEGVAAGWTSTDGRRENKRFPKPSMGRVVDGMAHRVDRLAALGNGQVPLVAATAWHILRRRFGD